MPSGSDGRVIMDVMRNADKPIFTQDITSAIRAAGGHGESAKPSVMPRVRGNLAYLHREKVVKSGNGPTARWELA